MPDPHCRLTWRPLRSRSQPRWRSTAATPVPC